MRDWFLSQSKQAKAVLSLGVAILCLLVLFVFLPLLAWNIESAHRIQQAQPRVARLLGFEGSTDALERALRESQNALDSFLHRRQVGEASVGSAAQRQLRRMAGDVGLTVQGSQVMEPLVDSELVDTRVSVDLRGDMESLEALLQALRQERPLLLPRELRLLPMPVQRGQPPAQNVIVKLVISAFSLPVKSKT